MTIWESGHALATAHLLSKNSDNNVLTAREQKTGCGKFVSTALGRTLQSE